MKSIDLLKGVYFTVFFRFLSFLMVFGLNYLIAFFYEVDDAGKIFWGISTAAILVTINNFGCGNLVVRTVSVLSQTKDQLRTEMSKIFFAPYVGLILVFTISLFLYYSKSDPFYFPFFVYVPFMALITMFSYVLQGSGHRFLALAFLTMFVPLVSSFIVFFDSSYFPLLRLLSVVFIFLCILVALHKYEFSWMVILIPRFDVKIFLSSVFLLFSSFSAVFIQNGGQFFLGLYGSVEEVAFFNLAMKLSMICSFVLIGANFYLSPKFAVLYKKGNIGKLCSFYRLGMFLSFLPSLVFCVILYHFSSDILKLFGDNYSGAIPLLEVLIISQLVNSLTGSSSQLANMIGGEKHLMLIMVASLFFCVVTCFAFYNMYGLVGIAWSITLTIIVQNLSVFILCNKILGVNVLTFKGDQ
ncbi:lipopolysaccharide biosynthesis protein [Neptunomonas phycophila]|uniref:lipopolysaccharide biosynthesis protein n=1 Tax=Neptunomonas phycophila TaxID=1572645 RepID=UPI0030FC9047